MNPAAAAVVASAGAAAARSAWRRAGGMTLAGRAAFVTGGSRGLGLALCRELARHGARVALCARDGEQVAAVEAELAASGAEAIGLACDVRDPDDVSAAVARVAERFGGLDKLIHNAATITVGPAAVQNRRDYADALATSFWAAQHTVTAALPLLRASDTARIGFVTSIGGKVAVPHLPAYSVGKFAEVGYAEGLRSELAATGIRVTTVVPGLIRTGSHVNARFSGRAAAEYRWFGLSASLPLTSTSAEHAARRIVTAVRHGDAEVILTWQAHLAVRANGLAPGLSSRLLGGVARLLPEAGDADELDQRVLGRDTGMQPGPAPLRARGDAAADRLRQR